MTTRTDPTNPPDKRLAEEALALGTLALPVALAQMGTMAIGAVGTAAVGRVGDVELGAVGLGNSIFFAVSLVGMGLMLGLDPMLSQAIGAGERPRARRMLRHGIRLAGWLTAPVALAAIGITGALPHVPGVEIAPTTASLMLAYVVARSPSVWPFLVFVTLRSYLQARDLGRPLLIAVTVANVVHLPLVMGLTFGVPWLGLRALGVVGCALAGVVAVFVECAATLWAVRRLEDEEAEQAPTLDDAAWRGTAVGVLRLGAPIATALLAEVGVFALANVVIARFGDAQLAAHNVALTLASATFMVPLGVGMAASARVGNAIGRGDTPAARRTGTVAFGVVLAFMSITACTFFVFGAPLARLFTEDADVVAAAVPLLAIAAVFQLSDGMQAAASGALRGLGDTRATSIANLLGHYALGLPLSFALGLSLGWEAQGIWWGLCAGLTAVALALATRFFWKTRTAVARVEGTVPSER